MRTVYGCSRGVGAVSLPALLCLLCLPPRLPCEGAASDGYRGLLRDWLGRATPHTADTAMTAQQQQRYMDRWHKDDAKMGVKNVACDDAESNLDVDWPGFAAQEYNCTLLGMTQWQTPQPMSESSVECRPNNGADDPRNHKCMSEAVPYSDPPPTSGNHRPLWPKYGEYLYVPPQRWMHNLEHGAVVFLYHPCASVQDVAAIKHVVRSCLRRHVITPYRELSPHKPLALVTWGCRLLMSFADTHSATAFIKSHALHGGEDEPREGQYSLGQVRQAQLVPGSDFTDSLLCPGDSNTVLVVGRDTDMERSENLMLPSGIDASLMAN